MGIGFAKPSTPIINKLRLYYFRFDLLQERKHVLRFYLQGDCSTDVNYWHRLPLEKRNNELGAIDKFIDSENQKLMLVLGDAGSGKSAFTQWLINYFCEKGNDKTYPGFVPIRIELKAYDQQSVKDTIEQALKTQFNLNAQEIEELRQMPDVVFLLDGYDEIAGHTKLDIYKANKCHEKWQNAKVIITCRNGQFKDEAECKEIFHIAAYQYDNQSLNTNYADLLYLAPFDEKQIEQYLDKFVSSSSNSAFFDLNINKAKSLIREHENLKAVIQNPFVLQIFAETFTNLLKRYENEINKIVMTDIYRQFLGDWFIHAKERLQESIDLTEIGKKVTDLKKCFYNYAQAFAYTLFAEDKVEITYIPINSEDEFEIQEYTGHKAFEHFFKSSDTNRESQKLLDAKRAACPLRRNSKDVYSFIHKSFQDYLAAQYLFTLIYDRYKSIKGQQKHNKNIFKDILDDPNHANHKVPLDVLNALNKRYITEDRLVLRFLSEKLEKLPYEEFETLSEELLLPMIQYSAKVKSYGKAASSIISILVAARKCMSGWDLRGVSIPKADLSRAILHRTNFAKADLREVRFNQAYISEANLSLSQMKGVQFGELPYLKFKETVSCLSFSPYIKTLAVGQDKEIVISEVTTGKQLQVLQGHNSSVNSVALSSDGTTVVSGSYDKSVRLWDVRCGKELQVLQGHTNGVNSVSISANGSIVASGSSDESVRLWDVTSGKELQVLQGHNSSVNSVALSSDGTTVVSGSYDKNVRLWDVRSGKELHVLQGHSGYITSVAISADGTTVASGSDDKSVRLWDVRSGKELQVLLGHSDKVTSVALNANGTTVASGSSDKSVRLWDAKSGKELHALQGHSSWVRSVLFSIDSATVISGGDDKSVRLWDAKSGTVHQALQGHIDDVNSVALSANGTTVASGSSDKSVRLWDAKSGRELQLLQGHSNTVTSVALSANGAIVASGHWDRYLLLWEAKTGKVFQMLRGHSARVSSVAISTDDTTVVSGSADKNVRLWDVKRGKELRVLEGHSKRVISIAISADGTTVASGSEDKSVRVWDVKSGKRLQVLQGHSDDVNSVAISADSSTVVSGSDDKSLRLWDIKSGKELQVLKGHSRRVISVAVSVDGTMLASGSTDSTIRIWELASYQCIAIIANGAPVWSVCFNKQGQLISGDTSPNNAVRSWQLINNQWHLKWSSPQQSLCLVGCNIEEVADLSEQNRRLIEQRSSEIKVLSQNSAQALPSIFDDKLEKDSKANDPEVKTMRDPLLVPVKEKPLTENDKKDKLVEYLFNDILKELKSLKLNKSNPRLFLVYAHEGKDKSKTADAKIARTLINWLHKDLEINLYSDRSKRGNGLDKYDERAEANILWSQVCLLPNNEHAIDYVILCGSQLIGSYAASDMYEKFYSEIFAAFDGLPTSEKWHTYQHRFNALSGIVDKWTGQKEFHQAMTELAFLQIRRIKAPQAQVQIIPLLLNGEASQSLPEFIKGHDVRIEESRWREHGNWDEQETYKSQGLHVAFFKLLERLYAKEDKILVSILKYKKTYDDTIELIQKGHFSEEEINTIIEGARKEDAKRLAAKKHVALGLFGRGSRQNEVANASEVKPKEITDKSQTDFAAPGSNTISNNNHLAYKK